ncbi:hypothetical protein N7603_04115 [Acholeplasma vituli]|uniref:Cellobiose phosphorylase n=1 Tax=Paracholeplasma vituli TaxID=69473 RepID=A0ABT2PWM5_9MOLU|nr:hypothetical protein [Paracholeplasma vituli]MCU0104836.1 hypothetical protein [Paracholeplasma vituli]
MKSNYTTFIQKNYQKQKPFSSFLPGIAGKKGIPLWSFYVNRGQVITSFGRRDKNGAILEFFPANAAYMYTKTIGFRTFIRVNGIIYEFFKEEGLNQHLYVEKESVSISEINETIELKVTVKYFTLPNEKVGALVRKVTFENLSNRKRHIEVLDGLTQILPSGIDYGGFKAISNLLQSWMDVDFKPGYAFYKLRASTGDSAEVSEVTDGNFYLSKLEDETVKIIADTRLVFDMDTAFAKPYGFMYHAFDAFVSKPQVVVNQVPCAFSAFSYDLDKKVTLNSLVGYTSDRGLLDEYVEKLNTEFLMEKDLENSKLHGEITQAIETETAEPLFDAYLKQCYLDNLLRGGEPFPIETADGTASYHLFSRKHGDLERDYNFFVIEPEYYSQGNGNFRDVLQNRRNDTLFHRFVKDHNLWHFASLISADSYNPLSIEGIQFEYHSQVSHKGLEEFLKKPFTPGSLYKKLIDLGNSDNVAETTMKIVLKSSKPVIKASFGEGYWNDHFTYIYDLIEGFLDIYPEQEESLLFNQSKYRFFDNHTDVLPREEKTVLTKDGKVRQYGALAHHHGDSDWLLIDQKPVSVTLASKLLTLVLNKYGLLDPAGIGLSYDANKPGWNDAMNGLPGLFGSGVSEMFELKRLNQYLLKAFKSFESKDIEVLKPLVDLIHAYQNLNSTGFALWDQRTTALENYRAALKHPLSLARISTKDAIKVLERIQTDLEVAETKALEIDPVYPTYLTFEATKYEPILENGQPKIGNYKLPLVKVLAFEMKPIPAFLEAPARYLKQTKDVEKAKVLYQTIKETELYDRKMKFYQTSVSLDAYSNEIGRIRAFTKGWLERESNFLHMTYKYLLGLLKAGLHDEFFKEIETNLVCFMNPEVYGRSPLENSSFIATSTNPDPNKHGQGFVSRLSGSTAEMLSMYKEMFIGKKPFSYDNNQLTLAIKPVLHHRFFREGRVSFKFFDTKVTYINPKGLNTYDPNAVITDIEVRDALGTHWIKGNVLNETFVKAIREGSIEQIILYINLRN